MRLRQDEALSYLSDKGFDISPATYYRIKKEIQETTRERLSLIASSEFLSQHLQRIDELNTVLAELWANYHKEKKPLNKSKILMNISEMQFNLANFFDSTRYIMEQATKMSKQLEPSIELKKKRKKVVNEG